MSVATAELQPEPPPQAGEGDISTRSSIATMITMRLIFRGWMMPLVYAIGDGPIAAVVSDLPDKKVRPERRRLAAHHEVLRRLMADHTVLPMAFGLIADGPESVHRILRLNRDVFDEQLERLRGKVEMGLRVNWDVPNIFEYIVASHPELAALSRPDLSRRSGAVARRKDRAGPVLSTGFSRPIGRRVPNVSRACSSHDVPRSSPTSRATSAR